MNYRVACVFFLSGLIRVVDSIRDYRTYHEKHQTGLLRHGGKLLGVGGA